MLACGLANPREAACRPPPPTRAAGPLTPHRVAPHANQVKAFLHREIDVELTATLSFAMTEALFQPRPDHWSKVWPAAVALSRWLLQQEPGSLGTQALELGCGVGLVSLTLAHLGIPIKSTDREPAALAFTLCNAQRNAVVGISVHHLEWGDAAGAPSNLLLASDVLYEQGATAHLFALVHTRGLLMPRGRLVIAGPSHRPKPMNDLVLQLIQQGYAHDHSHQSIAWQGQQQEIDVEVLRRPEGA